MKPSDDALSRRCASRVSSLPLVSSSPIDSRPTRGDDRPRLTRAYTLPMTANCSRCWGRHSTLAPTSSRMAGWRRVGIVTASAGRSTPGSMPKRAVCRNNRRAGVAGAEQRGRLAAGDQIGRDGDRRVRLAAQRRRRRVGHRDHIGRVDHSDAAAIDVRMPGELGLDRRGRPDERHAEIEMPRGRQRAVDDVTRREIAAHGVDGNPDHRVRDAGFE